MQVFSLICTQMVASMESFTMITWHQAYIIFQENIEEIILVQRIYLGWSWLDWLSILLLIYTFQTYLQPISKIPFLTSKSAYILTQYIAEQYI